MDNTLTYDLDTMPEVWLLSTSDLSKYQKNVLNDFTYSFVVKGPAGSGKTVLATHKMLECVKHSSFDDTCMLTYTKSLCKFIRNGVDIAIVTEQIADEDEIGQLNVTNIDKVRNVFENSEYEYVLVDEAQDFQKSHLDTIYSSSKKVMLFGDDAQKLYNKGMSIKDIVKSYSGRIESVYEIEEHYRTPINIVKYASKIINDDSVVKRCKNDNADSRPIIKKFTSIEKEYEQVLEMIKEYDLRNVGIFVNNDINLKELKKFLDKRKIRYNYKDKDDDTLNFNTIEIPTILTYHSSKGIQFENVFVINCGSECVWATNGNDEHNYKRALYVACTRTTNRLFIFYSGEMNSFMKGIKA